MRECSKVKQMKVGNNIQIISLEKRRAAANFILAFGSSYGASAGSVASEALVSLSLPAAPAAADLSLQPPDFSNVDSIIPKDSDFIYPIFRALSAVLIPGHWVDFSKEGVLKKSAPLLFGQTVYKNHGEAAGWFGKTFDVEKWLGAVSQSAWDAKGEKVGGISGINVELKIDALLNPRIARGLLMKPPAIHSVSVTVEFDYEQSHEMDEHYFCRMLGEEVDGEIVRLIVTEIVRYMEISLVFQGADGGAKQVSDDEGLSALSASEKTADKTSGGQPLRLAPTKEKTTVKLTAEQKTKFGITHEGEDVPEAIVVSAAESLSDRAAAGETLVASARAECLRVATLAEVGAAEGDAEKLPPAIAEIIKTAGASQLETLTKHYRERAEAKFKPTCQSCGSQNVATRSSIEDSAALPDGSIKRAPNTGATRLH